MSSSLPKKRLAAQRSATPRNRRFGPDARDVAVGLRVRALRLERNLSQTALANGLGLTFQQVQKYEKGVNRISAGRLQAIAEIFQVPINVLFSPLPPNEETEASLFELVDKAAALRLLRAYTQLPNAKLKSALVQLAIEMAAQR